MVNDSISVGDKVYLIDGSGLTEYETGNECLIVKPYPELTGENEILKLIEAEVIETGVNSHVSVPAYLNIVYVQDIVIKVGKARFRTASEFVSSAPTSSHPNYWASL